MWALSNPASLSARTASDTERGNDVGRFAYDAAIKADFDDRLLLHLQTVIGSKLRRGESFYFTWRDDRSIGDGRTTVWINPRSTLVYKFYGSRPPQLNRAWIEALAYTANSSTGLHVVPEPAQDASRATAAPGMERA